MARITRKELKSDRFASEVTHTVEYVGEHRRQVMLYGGVVLAVVVLAVGVYFYRQRQHSARQRELVDALETYNAVVTAGSSPQQGFRAKMFSTKAEKEKAIQKAFTDLAVNHAGTEEGAIAQYYLAIIASDRGNAAEAEKRFRDVTENASENQASLAKMALAQLEQGRGRTAEAEKLLRSIVSAPTVLVSKEQATIALARLIGPTRPEEARKLLEPLRTSQRAAISRTAITAMGELPKSESKNPPAAR